MLGRVREAARGAVDLKMEALGNLRSLADIAYCFPVLIAICDADRSYERCREPETKSCGSTAISIDRRSKCDSTGNDILSVKI